MLSTAATSVNAWRDLMQRLASASEGSPDLDEEVRGIFPDAPANVTRSIDAVAQFNPPLELFMQTFNGVCNRYEDGGPFFPCCDQIDCGVWCDHPGQRRREHEGAGRPTRTMSCELVFVAGRLCDSPGCAVSANP
jgi:hypothetical protein